MMKSYLEDRVKEYCLDNIRVLPYQPRELMPRIIAFSDIQFIFMEPEIAAQGFPSKVYTIMASSRPLLVCSPENTPIINFLDGLGCAKLITETSSDIKAKIISEWLMSVTRDELTSMGSAGLSEINKRYSKNIVTQQYCRLLESL